MIEIDADILVKILEFSGRSLMMRLVCQTIKSVVESCLQTSLVLTDLGIREVLSQIRVVLILTN